MVGEVAEHPNATAYRLTAEAFRAGETATVAALIAPDVVWHVPGIHAMAGEVVGRDALLDWLATLPSLGFLLTEDDVFGNDDHVCAISIMGARREGIDVKTRVVSVFRYRNGQQLERWLYPDDIETWNQIFGD
jgi:ketosteroid isomerase-like protein